MSRVPEANWGVTGVLQKLEVAPVGLRVADAVDYTSEFHVVFVIVVASVNDLECPVLKC